VNTVNIVHIQFVVLRKTKHDDITYRLIIKMTHHTVKQCVETSRINFRR